MVKIILSSMLFSLMVYSTAFAAPCNGEKPTEEDIKARFMLTLIDFDIEGLICSAAEWCKVRQVKDEKGEEKIEVSLWFRDYGCNDAIATAVKECSIMWSPEVTVNEKTYQNLLRMTIKQSGYNGVKFDPPKATEGVTEDPADATAALWMAKYCPPYPKG